MTPTQKSETTCHAFVAALFLAALLALAGCSSEPASCSNPNAPAGTWSTTTSDGGSYRLQLNADGTCAETGAKADGNPVALTCTWTASDGQIVFTTSDGSPGAPRPYWIVGDDLVIDQTTWSPVCADQPAPDRTSPIVGIWTNPVTDSQVDIRADGLYASDQGLVGRWFAVGQELVVVTPTFSVVYGWSLVDAETLRLVEGSASATYRRVRP